MSDARETELVPEIRTSGRFAIAFTVVALAAVGVAVFGIDHVEDALGSGSAAIAVLAVWCLSGCGGAIAAIVDAYVRPEGETLGLATMIAATVFGILGMVVVTSIALGAMDALR
jgi:hypothetical protein